MITVTRKHTFSAAHRLYDYSGKCEHLHGHNYYVCVTLAADHLDEQGMVLDFTTIKAVLMSELDALWDHKTLLWEQDPLSQSLHTLLGDGSVRAVPFNPTAENMAHYLGSVFFPKVLAAQLPSADVRVQAVTVYETEKSSATWQCERAEQHDGQAGASCKP